MSRFLFTTWEGGGNVTPVLALAARLIGRGHEVRVMSDEANRAEALAAGAAFVPWTRAPNRPDRSRHADPIRDWEAASPQEGFAEALRCVLIGPALAYATDVMDELRRQPADLVVTSEMLLGVIAGCEALGQKCSLFATNLFPYPLPGVPVFGPGLAPPRDEEGRALHAHIRAANMALLDGGLGELNAARLAIGLAPLSHVTQQLDVASAFMVATARVFDFSEGPPPAKLSYVGPQLAEPAWAQGWESPWNADDRPLVAVTFSTTFQNHAGVIQAVIDAVAGLPIRAAVTLAGIGREEVRAAGNVHLVDSASHDALMREAAVVVTHGGHGTVMRALAHGRPMLVIPHGRDQNENAVRVSERGAGLVLPPGASPAEIAAALQRLLGDQAFRLAAERLGGAIAEESARIDAAGELERLAA